MHGLPGYRVQVDLEAAYLIQERNIVDDFDCTADAAVDITRLLQPRIEAEIAFTLSDDITATITATDAPRFVHRVHAAFEIVESSIWSPESRELRLLWGVR